MPPRQWMILTYLYLRSGPQGISWETDRDMGLDLGLGPKKVGPHIRQLEALGFIVSKRLGRNRYVKLVDPMTVARTWLATEGRLDAERQKRLVDDLEQIRRTRRSRAESLGEYDED
jgi:DNA-binding MarR family transcriptional regulator